MAATVTLAADAPVTFHKDVEPILQRNCQTCHRPGQVAPMSFLTYQNVRPWAKAMKAAVVSRKMPPWFADPQHGPYLNDRSLKQNDIDTIAQWADAGAPEGDAKDAPVAVTWPQGWAIKPDVIVDGPVTDVPASPKNNVVEWITVIMPTGFTKDTWVTSVQIKPEFPAVTHHIVSVTFRTIRITSTAWPTGPIRTATKKAPRSPRRARRSLAVERREVVMATQLPSPAAHAACPNPQALSLPAAPKIATFPATSPLTIVRLTPLSWSLPDRTLLSICTIRQMATL